MIYLLILDIIFVSLFIAAILVDNHLYYKGLEKKKRLAEIKKKQEKKNNIELKWPDNLPRIF